MSSHETFQHDKEIIPRFLIRTVLALVAATLLIATFASLSGREPSGARPELAVINSRTIHLIGSPSEGSTVKSKNGAVIAEFGSDEAGFLSTVTQAINRKRTREDVDLTLPVELVQYSDERLAIFDPHSGWSAELRGFGKDNEAVFYNLLKN